MNPNTLRSRKRRAMMTPEQRSAEWTKYAKKRRVDLCKTLAPDGTCAKCGEVFPHEALTINHVDGITWDHNSVNQTQRHARYWREFKAGVRLNAMCGGCNSGYRAE